MRLSGSLDTSYVGKASRPFFLEYQKQITEKTKFNELIIKFGFNKDGIITKEEIDWAMEKIIKVFMEHQ